MPRLTATALAFLLIGAAGAAEFSSLEERMSQDQFHASGLDKLSPQELKNLNDWLRGHETVTTQVVSPTGQPVFYPKEGDREIVESRIDGEFVGWRGHTVFKLENGQEWAQAESGSFTNGKRRFVTFTAYFDDPAAVGVTTTCALTDLIFGEIIKFTYPNADGSDWFVDQLAEIVAWEPVPFSKRIQLTVLV